MSTLFERLDSAATELGKKVQAGVETIRLQGELFKLNNKRRSALEDLGRFTHSAARQGTDDAAKRDVLLADRVEYPAARAVLDDPQSDFGSVLESG